MEKLSKEDKEFYHFNPEEYRKKTFSTERPWRKDPHYFKKCKISLMAVIKMLNHARQGKSNEVMGTLMGKIQDQTFIVVDTFALPVEATETRVNAG